MSDPSPSSIAKTLIALIRALLDELRPELQVHVRLDSSMDRDLAIDSLARIELLLRCEQQFDISLPEQLVSTMETPRDLLREILKNESTIEENQLIKIASLTQSENEGEPSSATTLIEVLEWHVNAHPERIHVHLQGLKGEEERISYGSLMDGALQVCAGLCERGLLPGQSVGLMLPTGRAFFLGLYGTLMAGGIPVPVYPPMRMKQLEDHMRRQTGILSNAQTVLLITFEEIKPLAQLLKLQVEVLKQVVTVDELVSPVPHVERPLLNPNDIALLQYTSGSTGNPKGVVLTHANLLANIRAMGKAVEITPKDVFVSWLPLYHDMGLIGACMGSMYYALPLILMSPLSFIAHPQRWLWAIHKYRGTISSAPNFAYELCLRLKDEKLFEGLDLSTWRMACNGAEPVSPATIKRFNSRFMPYGFNSDAIAPVYGLAESSVGLTFPPPGRGAVIDIIKREPFMRHGHAIPTDPDNKNALYFVACGRPLPGHQVRIVDASGHEVVEREEGHLQFCGPSATSGYFRNQQASAELYDGKWLNSGDYAYIASGDIYLTGRAKDIIIRAGRNIYPQEFEDAIGNIDGIRNRCVAVFASPDPESGTERLIVMAETRACKAERLENIRSEINAIAIDLIGTPPDQIQLVPPNTVLKTSSGKIRRAASRQLFEHGISRQKFSSVKLQILRLSASSLIPMIRRSLRVAGHMLYASFAWTLFMFSAAVTWIIIALLPGLNLRRHFIKLAARLFLRLSGTPLIVHGTDHLPENEPYILVANHASYLDGIILTAALPPKLTFAVKQELKKQFIPRIFLGRIQARYVDRFDAVKGVKDASNILKGILSGESLAIMPEGTFSRAPGLRPFHTGAFMIAAKADVPIIPVAIRGTRSILRGSSWFPRRGIVSISIGSPIRPAGSSWNNAIKLRDRARAEILHHCGEPDLQQSSGSKEENLPARQRDAE